MLNNSKDINSIIFDIRSGKEGRDNVIKQLYYNKDLRNIMRSMIFKKGGSEDDFETVFNTSLMQFVKTVTKNSKFEINTSINSYILGISKYIWYGELRKRNKHKSEAIDNHYNLSTETTPESLVIDFSNKELISDLLLELGKKCKEVLMYWANGYKMIEIADIIGYKSAGMAKKKKHICLKELLLYLDKNPQIKSVLR